MSNKKQSRNKREGYYCGKWHGKHYRTPLKDGPNWFNLLIEGNFS